jgi:predicted nucleic acid-binding protein
MSALIATQGKTFDLIFNDRIKLFAPEFLFEEFQKYKAEILRKSGLSEPELSLFLTLVSSRIETVPRQEFKQLIKKAVGSITDKKDAPYIALALHLCCSVWSNDKKLKEQDLAKVYSTTELLRLF